MARQHDAPVKIRGLDALLGSDDEATPQQEIAIALIDLPASQPRKYFDPARMLLLTESVREKGILEPLLLRPHGRGRYELVAGERRLKAAQAVALTTVPAIIKELSDTAALEIALIENLQREDLSPLEETESLLDLLSRRLQMGANEVIALLNRKAQIDKSGATDSAVRSHWDTVEAVFNLVGRISPEGFRTHRLPLLNLPGEVLGALRRGEIEYTKARAIATVKDDEKRAALLQDAIDMNLTLRQVQERVLDYKPIATASPIKTRVADIGKRVTKLKDPKKLAKVEELLDKIQRLLD